MSQTLLEKLKEVEKFGSSTKLYRLLRSPFRYLTGTVHSKIIYPRTRKGLLRGTVTFFGEPMKVMLPSGNDLYLIGGKTHDSEIRLARLLINTLQPGDQFLDIGAHYGYFSLLAAKIVGPAGLVSTIEASKNTFVLLTENLHGNPNIRAHHFAASDAPGEVVFYEFPIYYSEFNSLDARQYELEPWYKKYPPTEIKVSARKMDDFIREQNINPRIIKIDVENGELRVITGMQDFLKAHSPLLVMEYLCREDGSGQHLPAARLLAQLGYRPHLINKDGFPEPSHDIVADIKKRGLESDNVVFLK